MILERSVLRLCLSTDVYDHGSSNSIKQRLYYTFQQLEAQGQVNLNSPAKGNMNACEQADLIGARLEVQSEAGRGTWLWVRPVVQSDQPKSKNEKAH